ncbi:MAG: hypothetical protein E6R13_01705 [Spirochaetes bacterium]|nr:MAG: hypothetical protein E6R13_01705 [Spirochaetota bacterium]
MEIKLKHVFINRAHDLNALLKDCNKLSTFCTRLEKQSLLYPDRYDPDKYKGDGFELFVEALIKLHPVDNRIGISNYQPGNENNDTGIDGYGVGIDGKLATVQVKYRSDKTQLLTANKDHLSNFVMSSLFEGVDKDSNTNMLIVTTADNLHHFTNNEMFLNKVRCIGYKQLRELVDNNINFWNKFRQLLNIQ